jgi:hypothetical protein
MVRKLHKEVNNWIDLRDKEITEKGIEKVFDDKSNDIEVKVWDNGTN